MQFIRPEFQAYLDNEQGTLQLVKDVADVLDDIAVNPLHTPALYSGFLRALINAKLEGGSSNDGMSSKPLSGDGTPLEAQSTNPVFPHPSQQQQQNSGMPPPQQTNNHHHHQQMGLQQMQQPQESNAYLLNEFQFDGEMGPVADITTFPPTMAPPLTEDPTAGLTMENILSSGFWDSMLVPGTSSFP